MAKTIKFNLICDEKPVRTIEDLQNNFSVEDILGYYKNGLLERWLDVRGYSAELEKVKAITAKEPIDIVKELIRIFNIATDEQDIEKSVYIFNYLNRKRKMYNTYRDEVYRVESIIDGYKKGYVELIEDIQNNPQNAAKIKTDIAEIVDNYQWILGLDYRRIFYLLKDISPLAIMCLLMNKKSRSYYIYTPHVSEKNSDLSDLSDLFKFSDLFNSIFFKTDNLQSNRAAYSAINSQNKKEVQGLYASICSMIKDENFKASLKGNLRSFSGVTDGYWKDLETKDKKYMIISMGQGDFVRSAGKMGGDLSFEKIENQFVILDGIDYKSNSSSNRLLYMEV